MKQITSFEEYSKHAAETQLDSCKNEDYLRLGLISEIGELAAIFKRAIRGDFKLEDKRHDILLELGDICWYLDRYADYAGIGVTYQACRFQDFDDAVWIADMFNNPSIENGFEVVEQIAHNHGFTIWDVLTANVEKLANRKDRGVITGTGDHR